MADMTDATEPLRLATDTAAPEGCKCYTPQECYRLGHIAAPVAVEGAETVERDEQLTEYLAAMDGAGGGIYTPDFRDGFRHALAMLAAYESDEEPSPNRARPETREAARLVLSRRPPVDPETCESEGGESRD